MSDLDDGTLTIPDYQRDADQWDNVAKSLLIESVINNLTIPAFFFEVQIDPNDGLERNSVVDGQQRLTTLQQFWKGRFSLVSSDEAPYLTPQSVHYAGKYLEDLPTAYKQAFKKYRLTVIKLRDLGNFRLETFRRINRGGEPLSGQDIRLAYYGEDSPTVSLVRLVGIYDRDRTGSKRFISNAQAQFGISFPWSDSAYRTWNEWWDEKDIARGQTPSEMFLWAVASAHVDRLDQLLSNRDALTKLKTSYDRSVDSALDALCAQLQFQDRDKSVPPLLSSFEILREDFVPFFQSWVVSLLHKGPSLTVRQHRTVAAVIGAAFRNGYKAEEIAADKWGAVVEFVRSPQKKGEQIGVPIPKSRGRWDGEKGYKAQLETIRKAIEKLVLS
jgi:hypothetical protein